MRSPLGGTWRLPVVISVLILAGCAGEESPRESSTTPVCDLLPDTLDFQQVPVGSSRDLSFTIANKGGGTLSGEVAEGCEDFSIISGGGSFQLSGGQSRTVSIRFLPMRTGALGCTLQTGTGCSALVCRAQGIEPAPSLSVSPDTLLFGSIAVGQSATRDFTITNAGGGILVGAVSASCADFDLAAGAGEYALNAGESRTVSVRFRPTGCGARICAVTTGPTEDTDVVCLGTGGGADCSLSQSAVDFGSVGLGSYSDQTFTITNTGCDELDGTISSDCPDFAVLTGGGGFTLAHGQARTVTVRYAPSRCGSSQCVVSLGQPNCPSITCSGVGAGGWCTVQPQEIDFGSVPLGTTAEHSFILRNDGCDTWSGSIAESCPYFVATPAGAYAIPAGDSLTVVVQFTPLECYTRTCAIDLGNALCGRVDCAGAGTLRDCLVSPTRLDFGNVAVGQFLDLGFSITNRGCDALVDSVAMMCRDFTLVTGEGRYTLEPGASRLVTVRFRPSTEGVKNCTIDAGYPSCTSVSCSGTGVGTGPACAVNPASIDFGTLEIWESDERRFTITNTGTSSLSGTVSESCVEYEIVAGLGSYNLSPGGTHEVTVRFTPADCGVKTCTIETGNGICSDVECTGSAGGEGCSVSTDTLDFGTVPLGGSADLIFQILNDGCQVLEGTPSESCPDFEIVGGEGFYSIPPGQFRNVTVRFAPGGCGAAACTLETGNNQCGDVACTGIGGGGGCTLSPPSLDFGLVAVGESTDRSFSIKNDGCSALAGAVTESCADYAILSGGGSYNLGEGDSVIVTLRFTPQGCGTRTCTVETGNQLCADLPCTGSGGGTGCLIAPTTLDFGTVSLGQLKDLTFSLTNEGCSSLAGTVTESCADYEIVSGGGSYNLSLGQSRNVTVRFRPTACGTRTCTIETGNAICSDMSCTGLGGGTICALSTTSLDFGTVEVGEILDRSFTITNDGCTTLTGAVSESCEDYEITVGGGNYSLNPTQSRSITVRFRPTECGTISCTIETGNSLCTDVSCTGIGGGSLCSVSPTSLDFGTVAIGLSDDRSFTITNTGCDALSGSIGVTGQGFSIVSGGGSYNLTAGQFRNVTVRFAPSVCGPAACTVETGNAACDDVGGQGVGTLSECSVAPPSLDFGTVNLGSSVDRSFTITNTGCEPLNGSVSEAWPDYEVTAGGGPFSLDPAQTRDVTVRFTPTVCGLRPCTVETGQPACGTVGCVGNGSYPSPVSATPTADAMVAAGLPDSTGCAVLLDRVGWEIGGAGELRTLLRFNLSSIPSQATVIQAHLDLFADGCFPAPPDTTLAVYLSQVNAAWSECAVTWNTLPPTTSLACSYALGCSTPHLCTIDCSPLIPLIQQWIGTPSTNHGLLLQPSDLAVDGAVNIRSRRFGSDPPRLTVWFTCP